jgi:hypothetical protein
MTRVMVARARMVGTLVVLVVLLLIGVRWGWLAVTAPFPDLGSEESALCEDVTVAAGEKVYPDQVTVSVLNAGEREGLASRTMVALVGHGLSQGQRANAPDGTEVDKVEIWTDDPQSPAVRLVATYLGKRGKGVEVVRRDPVKVGVNVVVGDDFGSVVKGRKSVAASEDTTICSPPFEPEPTA